MIRLSAPFTIGESRALRAGDVVLLSGVIYTARDAAHKRFSALLSAEKPLPVDIVGQVIYYAGPTPARPGEVIGSAGPTTSSRVDAYTPALLKNGLLGMIGKGARSHEVVSAMMECGAVYLGAVGGAGALISRCVVSSEVAAYPELGAEAVYRLVVADFPLTVVIDAHGNNLYDIGPEAYRRERTERMGE